mmetsp:Transcript_73676/g.116219  ORF Transcript_73676/g.116219 Transcript_73676/m.116219 type:complete len:171 (-) Transcript_73676:30-542(-)
MAEDWTPDAVSSSDATGSSRTSTSLSGLVRRITSTITTTSSSTAPAGLAAGTSAATLDPASGSGGGWAPVWSFVVVAVVLYAVYYYRKNPGSLPWRSRRGVYRAVGEGDDSIDSMVDDFVDDEDMKIFSTTARPSAEKVYSRQPVGVKPKPTSKPLTDPIDDDFIDMDML